MVEPVRDDDALERLLEFHEQRPLGFRPGGTRSFYRVGSSAWKRDRIPFMIHLGLPTAKYTLCGWPRRALERTDIDVVPQTDTHFEIRLPTCAHCRSVADGTSELSGGQLVVRGRVNWFGRIRPLGPR